MSLTALQAMRAVAITKHDDNEVPDSPARGLYIGTGGDVRVQMYNGGDPVTFKNVPDGTFMPIQVTKVFSTGTDAADMLALK